MSDLFELPKIISVVKQFPQKLIVAISFKYPLLNRYLLSTIGLTKYVSFEEETFEFFYCGTFNS